VATPGADAEGEEPGVEPGAGAGHDHVAGQGEVHPRPHGRAVHRRHRQQRRASHPQEPFVDVAQPGLARLAQLAEVGTGAEGAARSRHHDRPGVPGCLEFVERPHHGLDEIVGQRIAPLGVVEANHGDAVTGELHIDRSRHGCAPLLRLG
jgi:hypothetical protein